MIDQAMALLEDHAVDYTSFFRALSGLPGKYRRGVGLFVVDG